jgi:hypothetical protein
LGRPRLRYLRASLAGPGDGERCFSMPPEHRIILHYTEHTRRFMITPQRLYFNIAYALTTQWLRKRIVVGKKKKIIIKYEQGTMVKTEQVIGAT